MAQKRIARIWQAKQAFWLNGVAIDRGNTVVEGHPLLKGRQHLFEPFVPTFGEVEVEPKAEIEAEPVEAPA